MAVKPLCDIQKLNLANGFVGVQTPRSKMLARGGRNNMGSLKWLTALPLVGLLAACGSAAGNSNSANGGAASAMAVTAEAVTSPAAASNKLGAVLATIQYWDGSRPFMNLIYGGSWKMAGANGAEDLPAQYLDANGWIKSLPAGYRAYRGMSFPTTGGNFICRFQGNGLLQVGGPSVTNLNMSAGKTTFTLTTGYPNTDLTYLQYDVDPNNYIRNIDCREVSASATANFSPEFMSTVNGFKVLRFVKWTPSVEGNSNIQTAFPTPTITWATRNKPGDGDYIQNDGVPVEVMVDLANQAGASPWFNVPWNADDDYITRFATYVRDNLAPGQQVYVETSNEVWNPGYPVYHQAAAEGAQEGLPGDMGGEFQRAAERYGEKTNHVMQIWSNVFAGQMNRLVRVYAWQTVNVGYGEGGLKYALPNVDAYATAPYFAFMQSEYAGQSLDQIMNTVLPAKIAEQFQLAQQNKAIAQKYNLRFITYEAGQHVVLPNNVDLAKQIERDPRMYDLYKSYISTWQSQFGDLMTLFAMTGPISNYGGWGMTEYNGQPIDQAPKLKAVREFLGIAVASNDPAPLPGTQLCPDGSVIPSTSTCPVSSPALPPPPPPPPPPTTQVCPDGTIIPSTSTCPVSSPPTTTTSPGKKKGAVKGGGGVRNA